MDELAIEAITVVNIALSEQSASEYFTICVQIYKKIVGLKAVMQSLGVRLIIEVIYPSECSCLGINGCHLCLTLFRFVEAVLHNSVI